MNTRTGIIRRGLCTLGAAATLGLALAGPAGAVVEPDPIGSAPPPKPPGGTVIRVDDNALELFQVAGGMLAGLALAGAGAAVMSRRSHVAPHPA